MSDKLDITLKSCERSKDMPGNINKFIRNVSYTLTSNIVSAVVSVIALLLLPKFIGVNDYGYYQLYLFYITYYGVIMFGWDYGIYLRYGGIHYDEYNKPLLGTQFFWLGLYVLVLYFLIFVFVFLFEDDFNKELVTLFSCIASICMCLRLFLYNVLQACNRIREYALMIIVERGAFICTVTVLLLFGIKSYQCIIIDDIICKFISFVIGMVCCKDLVFAKRLPICKVRREIKKNINAGYKLLIASLASALIIGVVRYGVQNHWNIATFSKVSLTISISNLFMQAIAAIAVVLYPMLRRSDSGKLVEMYSVIRVILMGAIFGCLVFFYPVQQLLMRWLPNYADSLKYAAILLPICAFESKMSMLVNTYFKTLRMEKPLMVCNLISLGFSIVLTFMATVVFNSVSFAMITILIVLIVRCVIGELILSGTMQIRVKKDIFLEIVLSLIFIVCNWYLKFVGMFIYFFTYLIYLLVKKKDLIQSYQFFKSLRRTTK